MDLRLEGVRPPAFHFTTAFTLTANSSAMAASVPPLLLQGA